MGVNKKWCMSFSLQCMDLVSASRPSRLERTKRRPIDKGIEERCKRAALFCNIN